MTKKLYYDNTNLKSFDAQVISCLSEDDAFLVELSETAFYPEGGGQPGDRGHLNDALVLDVFTREGVILHKTDKIFSVDTKVTGILDWSRRHRFMQQHLGQHLLSAAFKNLFNAATVGFHMGEDYVTIDLDQKLSAEDVLKAEDLANQVVYDDLSVEALYPENDDLADLPLRKMPKVTENIRIIKVGEYDHTPCGGTHPSSTGQVGIVKVRKHYNYKSGIRIEFVCGRLALEDYREKLSAVSAIATDLSVKDHEVLDAYNRLKLSINDGNERLKALKAQMSELEAQRLLSDAETLGEWKLICSTVAGYDFNDLKNISNALSTLCPTSIRVFLNTDDSKATLLVEIPENTLGLSSKTLLKTALDASGGKGGGSDKSAQGSSTDSNALTAATDVLINTIRTTIGIA